MQSSFSGRLYKALWGTLQSHRSATTALSSHCVEGLYASCYKFHVLATTYQKALIFDIIILEFLECWLVFHDPVVHLGHLLIFCLPCIRLIYLDSVPDISRPLWIWIEGPHDLCFTIQWFCLTAWQQCDGRTSSLRIKSQFDETFDLALYLLFDYLMYKKHIFGIQVRVTQPLTANQ